jgi:hypothetical protein
VGAASRSAPMPSRREVRLLISIDVAFVSVVSAGTA